MVALLTPESSAMASILVESIPRSENSCTAASSTCLWAFTLLGLAISLGFNSSEEIGSGAQKQHGNPREQGHVECQAEMPGIDQDAAQAVDSIGQRVKFGDDAHRQRQIGQGKKRAGEKEDGHDQEVHH